MASAKEIKIIQAAKKEYAAAAAKGDKAGMAAAHAKADKARGYTTTTKVNSQGQYYQSVVSAEPPIARPEPAPPQFNWSEEYMKTMFPDMQKKKESGISVAAAPTAPIAFAPDSKPVLRGFYDSRNEMAGGGNPPAPSIGNLNINSLPQEKMDNTVRNTILAKAAAAVPSMGEFRQIDQGSIEPTVGDKLGWLGRSLTEGTANRVPAGFINAAGVLTGNLVSDLDPVKGQGVAERERLPFAEKIKGFGDKQNEIQGAVKALLQGENISGVIPKPVDEPTQESIQEAEAKRRAVQDAARNILSKADPFEQRAAEIQAQGENYGKGWQLAGGAISAAGDMIPAIAAGLLTKNPAAGMAVFGTQAGGQAAGQAYDETQDFNKAMGYGVGSAALEIGTEMIGGGIPGLGKGLLNPAISKVFKRIAEKPKLAWLLKESVDTVGEGAEEIISGALDPYVQRLTYNPEAEGATAEDLADQFTVGVLASIVLRAGVSVPGKAMSLNDKRNTLNALNELADMLPKETRPERLKFKINLTEEELNQYAESIRSAAMPRATEQTLAETSVESVQPVSGVQPIETPVRAEKPAERFDTGNTASANWKRQGQIVSVHRGSENAIVQPDALETARGVAGNPDYDIVRVNEKTGAITFIKTDDFDGKSEPKILSETTVTPDGNVRVQMPENKIIVDKASYVPEDYNGFDVADAKVREKEWRDAKKHGAYDPKRIEDESYFSERVKKIFDNVTAPMSDVGIPATEESNHVQSEAVATEIPKSYDEAQRMIDDLDDELISAYGTDEWLNASIGRATIIPQEKIDQMNRLADIRDSFETKENDAIINSIMGQLKFDDSTEEWVASKEAIENVLRDNLNRSKLFNATGSGENQITKESLYNQLIQATGAPQELWGEYDWANQISEGRADSPFGKSLKPFMEQIDSLSDAILNPKNDQPAPTAVEVASDAGQKNSNLARPMNVGPPSYTPEAKSSTVATTSYVPQPGEEINIKNDGKAVETVAAKEDNIGEVPEKIRQNVVGILGDLTNKDTANSINDMLDSILAGESISESYDIILGTLKGIEFTEGISQEISEETKALASFVRKVKLKITDDLKNGVPDFEAFRRRNFGTLRFTSSGANVDTFYAELSDLYPEYFSKEVTHPADQVQIVVDTVNRLKKKTFRLGDRLSDSEITDLYIMPVLEAVYAYRNGKESVLNERSAEKIGGADKLSTEHRQGETVEPVGSRTGETEKNKGQNGRTSGQGKEVISDVQYSKGNSKETGGESDVDGRNVEGRESGIGELKEESDTADAGRRVRGIEDEIRSRAGRTEKTEAEQKIAENAEKHYPNANIIFFDGKGNDPHGFSSYKNRGDIFINSSSENKTSIYYHELYHYLIKDNELGDGIRSFAKQLYDSGLCQNEIEEYVTALKESDSDLYTFFSKNKIMALEELLANEFANELLGIENFDNSQPFGEKLTPQARSFFKIAVDAFVEDLGIKADIARSQTKRREPPSSGAQYSKGNASGTQSFAGKINQAKGSRTSKADAILSGLPKNKTKTVNAIKASIMKNFKVNVYSKNFRRPDGVYAYFRPTHNIIAERYHSALGPTAHELGHKLDKEYSFRSMAAVEQMLKGMPGYEKEFSARGYKLEAMPGEVVADFVMSYLTNPDAAYELGSHAKGENFYDTFEKTLNKKDLENIRNLQKDILAWGAQDSVDKAKSMIQYRGNKEFPTVGKTVDRFMNAWIDNIYGAQQFIKAVNKGSGNSVKASNDTYEMLRKTLTTPSITSAVLTEGLINPQGFPVGKSFKEVLKAVKSSDMPLFDLYLKDVHSLDWMAQGKRVYSVEMDSEDDIRSRITKMEAEHPEFKETAEGLYTWWKDFTNMWLVGTGLHTKEFVDTLHEMYPHYVPNFRVTDGIKGQSKGAGGDPVKKAKGSDLPTYSATENLVLQIQNIIKAGVENQALSTLHTLYNNPEYSETVGLFLAHIPPDVQANRFDASDLKQELYKAVDDIELVDRLIADSITYFTPKKQSNDPNTVVAMINGKPKFYHITDEPLARAFMALRPKQIGGMLRMVKAMTRAFTGAVTANNPLFAVANHVRDLQHGLVMTESKYHALDPRTYLSYFKDILVSYGHILSKSKTYRLYEANAGMASKYMPEGDPFGKAMREIKGIKASHKKTKAGNAITTGGNVIAAALDLISAFNGVIESAPRLTAFRRAYKKGGKTPDALVEAIHASKEATVDFQRRGNVTAGLSTAIPFVGASIAGIDQFRRITMTKEAWTTKEGRQRLLRAVISQAIPAVIMAMIYADDDDWDKLHSYLKDGYWMIKYTPEKFIKLPKEREISAVFGTPFQRAALAYLQPDIDKEEELASYLKYMLETFVPAHEVTGWGLFDAINNKTWYGGVIVSQRDEALMQPGYYDEIYDETTSRLAVFLAKVMPDVKAWGALNTPKGIEYAIDQLTGGLGDIILPATTPSTGGVASELLRRYMTDSIYSNKYSNEAYEILAELEAAVTSGKRSGIEDEKIKTWKKAFSNTLSGQSDKYVTVSDYYSEIRSNNNDLSLSVEEREEKNRELRKKINRITEDIVKTYNAGGTPGGYSFADVVIPAEAKEHGISDKQYSGFINATTGEDKSVVEKKFALATMTDLTAEQKSWLSETVLDNKSYDEWGPAYVALAGKVTSKELVKIGEAVKVVGEGDPFTRVLKSGKNKGELKTEAISAGSKEEKNGVGKSASWKKKIAIDAAYPDADKETLEALYTVFGVSEKVWGYKTQ